MLVWGALQLKRRQQQLLLEPVPTTRGVTLSWLASFYESLCTGAGLGESFRRETLHHVALQPGEHVLDVGCGTGVLTRMAAEAVGPAGWVVGIDPAPRMLAVARENAVLEGKRAEFRLAAMEALPFADQAFDVVLASFVLRHLPPEVKRAGLHEVYRVFLLHPDRVSACGGRRSLALVLGVLASIQALRWKYESLKCDFSL